MRKPPPTATTTNNGAKNRRRNIGNLPSMSRELERQRLTLNQQYPSANCPVQAKIMFFSFFLPVQSHFSALSALPGRSCGRLCRRNQLLGMKKTLQKGKNLLALSRFTDILFTHQGVREQ